MLGIYKNRKKGVVSGVLAGIAERFNWDLSLTRWLFLAIVVFSPVGLFVVIGYIVAARTLTEHPGQRIRYEAPGSRKRKEAEVIQDGKWF